MFHYSLCIRRMIKGKKKERGEVTWCRGEELLIWEVYVRLVVLMKDVEAGVSCWRRRRNKFAKESEKLVVAPPNIRWSTDCYASDSWWS